jgi:hypothetical protein
MGGWKATTVDDLHIRMSLNRQAWAEKWPMPREECVECGDRESAHADTDAGADGLCDRCYDIRELQEADEEQALACMDEGPLPP